MKFKKLNFRNWYISELWEDIHLSINIPLNETALVINNKFFIINWDYRKDLKKLNTIEEIKTFFKNNQDKISWRSDDFDFLI